MNQLRRALITALRSGVYSQGRAALCIRDNGVTSFCCIGVGLNVATPGWLDEDSSSRIGMTFTDPGYQVFRDLYGVSVGSLNRLVSLNDGGASFAEIADYLEELWNE